jgi:hypothetical protein
MASIERPWEDLRWVDPEFYDDRFRNKWLKQALARDEWLATDGVPIHYLIKLYPNIYRHGPRGDKLELVCDVLTKNFEQARRDPTASQYLSTERFTLNFMESSASVAYFDVEANNISHRDKLGGMAWVMPPDYQANSLSPVRKLKVDEAEGYREGLEEAIETFVLFFTMQPYFAEVRNTLARVDVPEIAAHQQFMRKFKRYSNAVM